MSSEYTGDGSSFPETITIPDDGDDEDAASVDVPFETLADQIAYLRLHIPRLKFQVFTASGTFTVPARCTALLALGYGGGASGGSGSDGIATVDRWVAGGGGGGGSLQSLQYVAADPADVLNVDIGAGGTAPINSGDNGMDGGNTVVRLGATEKARFVGAGKGLGSVNHVVGLWEHFALGGVPHAASSRLIVGIGGGFRYDTSDAMWQISGIVLTMQPAQGGWGSDGSTHPASAPGQRNPVGPYTGGAAGARGTDSGTSRGGGGGGGGGAGPGGAGGAGGAGGDATTLLGAGAAGAAAAANTGAGGGGGGSSSYMASPADGALGGAGGSGKCILIWSEDEDAVE